MHDAFPDERAELMPVQKMYPLKDVVNLIRQYDFTGQRRVSFEYTMFSGHNDDKRHAACAAWTVSSPDGRLPCTKASAAGLVCSVSTDVM